MKEQNQFLVLALAAAIREVELTAHAAEKAVEYRDAVLRHIGQLPMIQISHVITEAEAFAENLGQYD